MANIETWARPISFVAARVCDCKQDNKATPQLSDTENDEKVDQACDAPVDRGAATTLNANSEFGRPTTTLAAVLGRNIEHNRPSIKVAAELGRNFSVNRNPSLAASLGRLGELYTVSSAARVAAAAIHDSWRTEFLRHSVAVGAWQDLFRTSTPTISKDILEVANTASRIQVGTFARISKVEASMAEELRRSLTGFEQKYTNLVGSFKGLEDLARRPAFVLPGATRELASTNRVLASLQPTRLQPFRVDHDEESNSDVFSDDVGITELFERVDPVYATMYSGAVDALATENPERVRHVLSTLRELASHLLRDLAPYESLTAWIDDLGDASMLHEGKPTRRSKVLFILKDVSDEPLSEFVEQDAKVFTKLYGLYDRLHQKQIAVNDKQLRAIVAKTESFWRYLLRTYWSSQS